MRRIAYADLPSFQDQEIGVSDWLRVEQNRVDQFADATGDHQWIHVDAARAERERGGTIAHGFLTLSLIGQFWNEVIDIEGVAHALNYGLDKVRFLAPVPVGARVRLRLKLKTCEPHAVGQLTAFTATIELEGSERPACVAELLVLLYAA